MTSARSTGSLAFYGLTAAAVWLAWEVIKAPIVERAPVSMAVRLAPGSPEVLARAAEAELLAGRLDNARALAEVSLLEAPFNARTLRVLGLTTAQSGEIDRADNMLTLAGNWSLRDDPSHAWLIERRLRQGNFDSAFAHADTLARRWDDGKERIYDLFAKAVLMDQRALPSVAAALSRRPPWRSDFILYLLDREDGAAVLLALGFALADGDGSDGYTGQELSWIYQTWYDEGRLEAIRVLRTRIGRPGGLAEIQNGDFTSSRDAALLPFGWRLDPAPGISADFIEDDLRANDVALRVEYDGYAIGVVAQQVLMLPGGKWTLSGEHRLEAGAETSRLRWRMVCAETSTPIISTPVEMSGEQDWSDFQLTFTVPATGCAMQRLRLEADPGPRRTTIVAWFDKLRVDQASGKLAGT